MKLYEIEKDSDITITVTNVEDEDKSVEYNAKVLFEKQEILFLEPIKVEGKMLDFSSNRIKISVSYVPENDMPLFWRGCSIKDIIYEGKRYHILYSVNEGKHVNRRNTYRQYIGYKGVLQLGPNRKTIDVTVKDISVTGISFISVSKYEEQDIGLFHLSYIDEEFDIPIQVSGNVVRIEEMEDTRTFYGCRLVESNINIGNYIAHKQKKEAERRRLRELFRE